MTDQERIERVEKAIETIQILSSNQVARVERLEKLNAELAEMVKTSDQGQRELDETIAELKRMVAKQRRRLSDVGQAIGLQAEVSRSHDESIEELRAEQSEFDRKLTALADAQIRTEDKLATLADAQAHSDRKLDALIDVVRDLLDGRRSGGGPAI